MLSVHTSKHKVLLGIIKKSRGQNGLPKTYIRFNRRNKSMAEANVLEKYAGLTPEKIVDYICKNYLRFTGIHERCSSTQTNEKRL